MEPGKSKEQVAEFYEEFQSRGKYDYFMETSGGKIFILTS